SSAASACHSLRKPRSAGGLPSASERNGSGAIPIPPPTSNGRSTSSRKPTPRGPSTRRSSPGPRPHSARVPGPIGSTRNASSPGGARQRLNGRGSRRPGASSMKNWPGTPGSRPPRSTHRSVYGPTGSLARTLSRSDLDIEPFLERERRFRARAGDRVDGRGRARERRDARDARRERRLADSVAVGACVLTLRRVDHEIAASPTNQVDDRRTVTPLGHPSHRRDGETGGGERGRRARGGDEREA